MRTHAAYLPFKVLKVYTYAYLDVLQAERSSPLIMIAKL